MQLCCPISDCGVPSLTTVDFGLEACNFEDKNSVNLASWKNKKNFTIVKTGSAVVTAASGRVESTLTVADLNSFVVSNKSRNCLLKAKARKGRTAMAKLKTRGDSGLGVAENVQKYSPCP